MLYSLHVIYRSQCHTSFAKLEEAARGEAILVHLEIKHSLLFFSACRFLKGIKGISLCTPRASSPHYPFIVYSAFLTAMGNTALDIS